MSVSTEPDKPKLPEYEYEALNSPNALRLLRLRPASDENHGIDAELAEFGLPEHGQGGIDVSANGQEKPSYEAVSWCWGREKPDQLLRMHKHDKVYAFHISKNLKTALWALRKHNEVRYLWVDAICIDQKNTRERNEQVPKMDRIYGNANSVCIWLGDADEDSKVAMDFIKNQVLSIWGFDMLIENRDMARQWASFIKLMKRPWFSRRWVVQEVALSPSGGTLYCGKDEVPWSDFADAVSLFVEVESATHRLSDVMKLDQKFGHIPDFFGDVSSLGAALLVDATSNLFRNAMTGKRQPLSTLEYLVSRLSVFEASQPRDTIYALLAISSDTTPQNVEQDPSAPNDSQAKKTVKALARKQAFASQPYNVDYKLPVIDVYKEFIEFAIRKSEKARALDIICRPWAPIVLKKHDKAAFLLDPSGKTTEQKDKKDEKDEDDEDEEVPLPSWIPSLSGAAFEMEEHPTVGLRMERQNADPLVGFPGSDQRNYSAAGTRALDVDKLKFVKWTSLQKEGTHYPDYSMFVQGFILDEVSTVYQIASNGNMPYQWLKPGRWTDTDKKPPDAFWRTLVADRGPSGRNSPTYFPRACRESMKFKAKTKSKTHGTLDSKRLINEGQCTIVAEFLRRVQAVIWNRLLMKTKDGRLGLVRDDVRPGYKICILYGCSVPVVLQETKKDMFKALKEQMILYDEWLQKRERVVTFFQAMWRMRGYRRSLEVAAQKLVAQKMTMPKLPQEVPKGLESQRKPGTWPLKTPRESKPDKSPLVNRAPSGKGTPSGNETIHETEISDANDILPDDGIASLYSSVLVDQTAPQYGIGFLASSQEETTHGDGETGMPLEPVEALRNALKPESIQQEIENHKASQVKGKQKEIDGPQVVELKQKKWKQLSLPERKALGRMEAEAREAYEFKLALTPSYYTLFGECYVHGMMNGEAIALQNTMLEKGQMGQQVFELR
jgi:Heterokaryon incompatibility protein (HET)